MMMTLMIVMKCVIAEIEALEPVKYIVKES